MSAKLTDSNRKGEKNKTQAGYSFIQEQIVPKKRSKRKKLCCTILFTIIIAVIFGLVSCCIFYMTRPFFVEMFDKGGEKAIVLNTTTPTPAPSVVTTPKPTVVPGKVVDPATVEPNATPAATVNPTEASLEEYMKGYELVSDVVAKVNQSIVTVEGVTSQVNLFNNPYEKTNVSAGLVVANNGTNLYILANKSRVGSADNIRVTIEKTTTIDANLFGYDRETGIAILSVPIKSIPKSVVEKVVVAKFGDSFLLAKGYPIIAVGSPNGYMYSMEQGIITNQEEAVYITDYQIDLFNTDIDDNENGEGFIINLKGEVIGVITHSFKTGLNENINTVIGMDNLSPVIEDIVNKRKRQFFGIIGNDINSKNSSKVGIDWGIYVTEVETDSPAFKAEIKTGDVIQSVENNVITTMVGFYNTLSRFDINEEVKVVLLREVEGKNKEITLNVTIGQRAH